MAEYTQTLQHKVIYSTGDTHGQGRRVLAMLDRLREKSRSAGEQAAFIQLGDLCDAFSFPPQETDDALRKDVLERMARIPELSLAMRDGRQLVDWRLDNPKYDYYKGSLRGTRDPMFLLEEGERDQLVAIYQAGKCYETLKLYFERQQADPEHFYVVFGNHDADLLRGRSDYGRQQKYLLLGLLGFSPDEVIAHMQKGTPDVILRAPWLAWLNTRPHLILSRDTAYMHGGPTTELVQKLGCDHRAFRRWIRRADLARHVGWNHPMFKEHFSFLSPDGAPNDWLCHPERIAMFCHAAHIRYLAVGHSPFLDFEKGPLLDLKNATPQDKQCFVSPALLPPDARLIKHDTNLKRYGELWFCRHETGSSLWTAWDEATCTAHAIRCGKV